MGSGQKACAEEAAARSIDSRLADFKDAAKKFKHQIEIEGQYGLMFKIDDLLKTSKKIIDEVPLTKSQRLVLEETLVLFSKSTGSTGWSGVK